MRLLPGSLVLLGLAASLASRSSSAQTAPAPASVAPAAVPADSPAGHPEVAREATQRRSDGMLFGGLGLIGTGLGVAVGGGALFFGTIGNIRGGQDRGPAIVSGFIMMVGGGLGVLVGIPLAASGAHRVPVPPREEAKLVVGPGHVSLQVPF